MFAFERSSTSPFGQTNSVFGQNNSCNNPFTPKPFGSTTPFGSQMGSSIFGGTSTGVFGAAQTPSPFGASCSPAFGSSMPAFGSSSTPAFGSSSTSFGGSSGFGQKPAFGGFGSTPTQTNPFGSATQPSQPVFGSSIFGSSTPFGASSQPAFGSTGAPAFGATSTPAFGTTSTPSFGATSIPAFGATSAPTFGVTSTPAFVPTLIPAFGSTGRLFGVSNASFGGGGAFGSSSPFGSKTSAFRGAFGLQTPTSVFADSHEIFSQIGNISDSYPVFIGQTGNISRVSDLAITEEDGGSTSGQTAKLESIAAMPAYKDLRYESCVAIAGADYCVIAADYTHDHTKISQINEKSVMASCGFQAGVKALQEVFSTGNLIYKRQHNKPMSCPAMTKLLSRFWKYHLCYASIVLGGLDGEGKGCVFTHYGGASSRGISGAAIITPPILEYKLPAKDVCTRLSETEAVDLAKTIFASTTRTGDKLEIVVLNASGLRREYMDLRKD